MTTAQGKPSPAPHLSGATVRAMVLAAAALLPWLYALGNELFLTKLHGGEGGDLAVLELGIFDAWDGERLIGPYSRFGWHHPGPLYFYLLLPIYALSRASACALFITSSLIGCAALGGLLWTAWTSLRDTQRSWLCCYCRSRYWPSCRCCSESGSGRGIRSSWCCRSGFCCCSPPAWRRDEFRLCLGRSRSTLSSVRPMWEPPSRLR